MFRFLLLAALLPAFARSFEIIPCDGVPLPLSLVIPECPASEDCNFHVGQQITLIFSFQATATITEIPTEATITSPNGESHHFPLPSGNACNAIAGGCPIGPGVHTVQFPVAVVGIIPEEEVTIKVLLNNQDGFGLVCGQIKAEFAHP